MKRVFSSHSEVAHVWAQDNQSEGRASNMFFENGMIFSYGRHFCIARILPSGAVAFTTRSYSSSTSKHTYLARSAARHRNIVYCNDPSDAAWRNAEVTRKQIDDLLTEAATRKGIRQTTRAKLRAQALHTADQFNEYLAALPEEERGATLPIDTSKLEDIRAEMDAQRQAYAAAEQAREAQRREKAREELAEWRDTGSHRPATTNLYSIPPALRLSVDRREIETSHGAIIPLAAAMKLWPVIQRVLKGDRDYEVGMDLGHYRLTKIRRDGSIVVGCHDIAFAEIEGIARNLGLLGEEVAA